MYEYMMQYILAYLSTMSTRHPNLSLPKASACSVASAVLKKRRPVLDPRNSIVWGDEMECSSFYTYKIRIFLELFDDTTQTLLVAQVDLSIWNLKVINKDMLFQHCTTRLLRKESFTISILTNSFESSDATDLWYMTRSSLHYIATRKRSTKSPTCCNAAPFDLDEIHCVARMATQRHVLTHFDRQVRSAGWKKGE